MNGTRRAKASDRAALWAAHGLTALAASLLLTACARGQAGVEELDRSGVRRVPGRIEGDARSGFRFAPRDGGSPIALEPGVTILREARDASVGGQAATGPPPFQVMAGEAARLSGSIHALTKTELRWGPSWQAGEVAMPRGCVQAIVQRPGEARVLADGFSTIDAARWSVTGKPETAEQPRLEEGRSLRLPAEGASLTHNLEEPLSAGRLELAFHDDGTMAPGRECTLEPIFRGSTGPTPIRIILGWSEESLGVETPAGPSLQIQRLAHARAGTG